MAIVLEFKRPVPVDLKTVCAWCSQPMVRRSMKNEPAYCDYTCAQNGQPEHARAAIIRGRENG